MCLFFPPEIKDEDEPQAEPGLPFCHPAVKGCVYSVLDQMQGRTQGGKLCQAEAEAEAEASSCVLWG